MDQVSRVLVAAKYTGTETSAADVLAACQMITPYTGNVWSLDSWSPESMTLRETPAPAAPSAARPALWPVITGQMVVIAPDFGIVGRLSQSAFDARYRALSSIFSEAAHTVGVVTQQEVGAAPLPLLTPNATATVTVPLTGQFPTADYVTKIRAVSGTSVLSMIQILGVTRAPGSVQVQVKANGLASVAGLLLVDAYRTA